MKKCFIWKFWTFNCIKLPVGSFLISKQNNNRRSDVGSLWKLNFTPEHIVFQMIFHQNTQKLFIHKATASSSQKQQQIQQSSINCDCSLYLIPFRSLSPSDMERSILHDTFASEVENFNLKYYSFISVIHSVAIKRDKIDLMVKRWTIAGEDYLHTQTPMTTT